uniref:Uncharacterized protein n=1 Tax=Pithovirus LCPAC401 TaxID=2506595 RepID=A0A481ZDT1_9VIRU|nr:MAG: hypothetical protein LCPAC401_04590 [Pithovirus LCPAC401]
MAIYRTFSEVRRSYRDEEIYQVDYFSSIEEARKYGLSSNLINVTIFSLMKLDKKTGQFNEIELMEGVGDEEEDVDDSFPLRRLTREEISELPKFIYLFTHSEIGASYDETGTVAYIDEESLLKNSTDIYDTWKSVLKTSKPLRETYDQYRMFNGVVKGDENFNTFEDALEEILPSDYRETYMEKYEIDNPKSVEFLEYNFSSEEKLRSVYEFARAYAGFHSPEEEKEILIIKDRLQNYDISTLNLMRRALGGRYESVNDKEENIDRYLELRSEIPDESKDWYEKCTADVDPITLEDLKDYNRNEVVTIYLGYRSKGECYVIDELLNYWKTSSGFVTYEYSDRRYYKLPLSNTWVDSAVHYWIRIIKDNVELPRSLHLSPSSKRMLVRGTEKRFRIDTWAKNLSRIADR